VKDLNYQLMKLCRDNRDGGYSTQATRRRMLDLVANQLEELGFRRMQAKSLKPKHIDALVSLWKDQGIGVGTRKNRLSVLRWWAKKVGKADIIAADNSVYGIGRRKLVAETSKAQSIDPDKLRKVSDPYVRLSIRLQAEFGLRREESIKFSPGYAIQEDLIKLKASWTKGGRARTVPIRTDAQRQLLEEVRALAKGGALIPPERNYVEQLHRYERQLRTADLHKLHGLRHAYAQRRYAELTGWQAPVAGGPAAKSLSDEQRALDRGARLTVSRELGHARIEVSAVYLGS
jgi:site-specific recombinase XerC